MTHRVKRSPSKVVFCSNLEMCVAAGFSSDKLKNLRIKEIFKKGIHWINMPDSDRILWNRDLVIDLIVHGVDSLAHEKAVERFRDSLPSSDNYQLTAA